MLSKYNAPTMGRTVGTYHGIRIRKFTNATRALPSVVSTTTAGVAHAGLRMRLAIAPSSLGWTLTRYGRMAVAFDRYRRQRGGAGLSGAGPRTRRGGGARGYRLASRRETGPIRLRDGRSLRLWSGTPAEGRRTLGGERASRRAGLLRVFAKPERIRACVSMANPGPK